jgi:hypothetical protein
MQKSKFLNYFAISLVALAFLGTASLAPSSFAATCHLTKIQISQAGLTATTEKVALTATPSCWSGAVDVNQGNRDFHLITVSVVAGHGIGVVQRQETTGACSIYCIHPYAPNPGVRGNNIFIPVD